MTNPLSYSRFLRPLRALRFLVTFLEDPIRAQSDLLGHNEVRSTRALRQGGIYMPYIPS